MNLQHSLTDTVKTVVEFRTHTEWAECDVRGCDEPAVGDVTIVVHGLTLDSQTTHALCAAHYDLELARYRALPWYDVREVPE